MIFCLLFDEKNVTKFERGKGLWEREVRALNFRGKRVMRERKGREVTAKLSLGNAIKGALCMS